MCSYKTTQQLFRGRIIREQLIQRNNDVTIQSFLKNKNKNKIKIEYKYKNKNKNKIK